MNEIVHLNYIKANVDSSEIGNERQLDLLLSNDDIKSSSRTNDDDHDYYFLYDAEDENDNVLRIVHMIWTMRRTLTL